MKGYLVDIARAYSRLDGMGHRGGDVASRLAVRTIHAWIKANPSDQSINLVEGAIQQANHKVWEASQGNPDLRGMGTTATVALIGENRLFMGHVGDSALFRISNNHIEKLSRDHTLAEQMVSKGLLSEEECRSCAYNHIIRAVGMPHWYRWTAARFLFLPVMRFNHQ